MTSNRYELIIYIPTFNRCEKLKNCMHIVSREMTGLENKVLVYISNNGSTDGTREYLDSLDYPWLHIRHNERNLGFALNVLHGFDLPIESEFVWTIGDDEYLMPNALSGILSLIRDYPDADYIFCNTTAFPSAQSAEILSEYFEKGSIGTGMLKSRKYTGTRQVDFEWLIDPDIVDTLLGELMISCFRQSSVRFPIEDESMYLSAHAVNWEDLDLETAGQMFQPHNMPFLHCFNGKTKAVYCDTPRTFNFWGSADWIGDYDYTFPIIILFLISQYKERRFISEEKYFRLLDYYYSVMRTPLTRQLSGQSTARPFTAKIKARMFDFLFEYSCRRWDEFGKTPAAKTSQAGSNTRNGGKHTSSEPRLTSIIMLTFNQMDFTRECVESIDRYTPELHEIIFVDNGSTDGTRDYLQEYTDSHDNASLILNETNRGFAAGNNQGIARAKGDYIVLLNNDVVVTEQWLKHLIAHAETSPDIGMVGPMTNSVSGAQLVEDVPYKNSHHDMQKFAQEFAQNNLGKNTEMVRLVGFCILIKKEVLESIDGLDENYGSGNFEDDDLCLRSYIAGYRNIIAEDVFIHHYGSMTFKGNSIDYAAAMRKNLAYFGKKWNGIIETNDTGYRIHLTKEQQIQKLISWGEEKYTSGDLKSAVKIFERVLMLERNNAQALTNLGVIQWQLGRTDSAVSIFQKALFIDPNDRDALANLVQAVEKLKRADLVQGSLVDLLQQSQPENPDFKRLIEITQQAQNA